MPAERTLAWLRARFELGRHGASGHYASMEGLRGLAVSLVFLVHYATLVRPWVGTGGLQAQVVDAMHRVGNAGVDLFFVLSGFLIYDALMRTPLRIGTYLRRRARRIYPTFLFVLGLYLLLSFLLPSQSKLPAEPIAALLYVAANLVLLPGVLPIEPIITVAWSLSYEMLFYLVMPGLIAVLNLKQRSAAWRSCLFAGAAAAAIAFAPFGSLARFVMFASGMLVREALVARSGAAPGSAAALLATLGALAMVAIPGFPGALAGLFVGFFTLCFTCFARPQSAIARALSVTGLRWLGNMSYSFYLLHGLTLKAIFMVLASVIPAAASAILPGLLLLPVFLLTLIPAALLFLTVERPLSLRAGNASSDAATQREGSAGASAPVSPDSRPLVLHVVYRFDVGGLENGIVNLINHMPAGAYRHAIVALTDATDFSRRIERGDVLIVPLHKPPGHGFWLYPRLYALFRELRPAIVHTRNLAALEAVIPAWLARVPVRIHGEHGRDVDDLDGSSRKHQWLRRVYQPFVHHYVAVSHDLADYLVDRVGVAASRVTQIGNGVDLGRFHPAGNGLAPLAGCPFSAPDHWIVGTVGRMQPVKDQTLLAGAFVRVLELEPRLRQKLRLVMVGDGPLRAACTRLLTDAGCAELAWLPGERNDVPDVMRGLACFVLPSLAEGISNTILEAMASGLPVIATDVGGSSRLIDQGSTGQVVPAGDVEALALAILGLARDADKASAMGRAGRLAAEQRFSIRSMVQSYQAEYDRQRRPAISTQRAIG